MTDWMIDGETVEEQVEAAVNTIIGMSLVQPVTIAVQAGPLMTDGADVQIRGNGDTGVIHCETREAAEKTAALIFTRVQRELAEMPPFSGRKPIMRQEATR